MRLRSLAKLLSGTMTVEDYSSEISAELAQHTQDLATASGTALVTLTEDTDLTLDRAGLGLLCRLFASGKLTAAEFSYTADALQMADRVEFSGPDIASDLAECTDPEVNGPLTVARALEIAASGAAA